METTVRVKRIDAQLAASALAGFSAFDATGMLDEQGIAPGVERSMCFAALSDDEKSAAVYTVRIVNGVAWVDFAKGSGPIDWCAVLGPVIEQQVCGAANRIAFQTMRPGLKRRALRQGYSVRGWIMGKDVQ